MRTVFVHHKGGTGKTTSCLQIGGALVKLGRRVLIVDTDPQANATIALGVKPEQTIGNIYKVYLSHACEDAPIYTFQSCILHTNSGIDLIPSNLDLVGVEPFLYSYPDRYNILETEISKISNDYDHILIDTPPFLGQFVLNGLMAADKIIFVFSPDIFAIEGYKNIRLIMQDMTEIIGRSVPIGMAILNRFEKEKENTNRISRWFLNHKKDKDQNIEADLVDQIKEELKFDIKSLIVVPESHNLSLSFKSGIPLTISNPENEAAMVFAQAAEIIDNWMTDY